MTVNKVDLNTAHSPCHSLNLSAPAIKSAAGVPCACGCRIPDAGGAQDEPSVTNFKFHGNTHPARGISCPLFQDQLSFKHYVEQTTWGTGIARRLVALRLLLRPRRLSDRLYWGMTSYEQSAQRPRHVALLFHSLGISERRPPIYPTHFKHRKVHELMRICREHSILFQKSGKRGRILRKDLETAIVNFINGSDTQTVESQSSAPRGYPEQDATALTVNSSLAGHISAAIVPTRQTIPYREYNVKPSACPPIFHSCRVDLFKHQRDFVPAHSYYMKIASGADLDLGELAMAIGLVEGCLVLDPVYRRPFASRRPMFIAADEFSRLVEDDCLSIIGKAFYRVHLFGGVCGEEKVMFNPRCRVAIIGESVRVVLGFLNLCEEYDFDNTLTGDVCTHANPATSKMGIQPKQGRYTSIQRWNVEYNSLSSVTQSAGLSRRHLRLSSSSCSKQSCTLSRRPPMRSDAEFFPSEGNDEATFQPPGLLHYQRAPCLHVSSSPPPKHRHPAHCSNQDRDGLNVVLPEDQHKTDRHSSNAVMHSEPALHSEMSQKVRRREDYSDNESESQAPKKLRRGVMNDFVEIVLRHEERRIKDYHLLRNCLEEMTKIVRESTQADIHFQEELLSLMKQYI
ncbi:hypothetical protein NM688_g5514 [Phlebia brevispora]|uniref:Uncharacterized protein n=1 Tax=Phlebia brevispora TaxID=194682 RepID=A0ACC1SU95_9APHY|nr:hypothetical protein NM688_g5514 [Phlebia brevispora]